MHRRRIRRDIHEQAAHVPGKVTQECVGWPVVGSDFHHSEGLDSLDGIYHGGVGVGEESVDDGKLADGAVVGVVLAHESYVEGCLVHFALMPV